MAVPGTGPGGGLGATSSSSFSNIGLAQNNYVYTGNNVLIYATKQAPPSVTPSAGQLLGLVQTLTINRSINRRPVQQVGTGLFADAPPTAIQVTATLQNLVPRTAYGNAPANDGKNTTQQLLSQLGIIPSGNLEATIYNEPFTLFAVPIIFTGSLGVNAPSGSISSANSPLWQIIGCYFTSDSITINETTPISVNVSLIARNAAIWS